MEDSSRILNEHQFFDTLDQDCLDLIVGCARNVVFRKDEYLVREGDEENDFYLLRDGRVAIEIDVNFQSRVVVTVEPGEILGWSWLLPPYQWAYSARAVTMTRVLALDGKCLRRKCEENHSLGYELLKRFAVDIEKRLHKSWLQVGDMYAPVKS